MLAEANPLQKQIIRIFLLFVRCKGYLEGWVEVGSELGMGITGVIMFGHVSAQLYFMGITRSPRPSMHLCKTTISGLEVSLSTTSSGLFEENLPGFRTQRPCRYTVYT